MLIGTSSNRPDLEIVRRIKLTLHKALCVPEDGMITVTQLACLEEGCAPLETVVGLIQPGASQLQYKVHKPTNDISTNDLIQICEAWGYEISEDAITSLFKES